MKNFVSIFGAMMILLGVFGVSYTWHTDHRNAQHLSAYCRIDFRSSHTEEGRLEGAVFTLWDYRYGKEKLLPRAILYTDGSPWEIGASVKQNPPPQTFVANALQYFFGIEPVPDNREDKEQPHSLQNENKLFFELPKSSLATLRNAETVRLRFYYDNGDTIDLPLSKQDTEYWRRQVAD